MSDESAPAEVCVMNLGASGRRARRHAGVVALAAGRLPAVALIVAGGPGLTRLPLAALFQIGLAGLLQARGGT